MKRAGFGILVLLLASRGANAQATVSGVVFDSIARAPLGGAAVQLVASNSGNTFGSTVNADSLGNFAFAGVPAGRYMLGFFHPMTDSLFIAPPVREIVVEKRPVRADIGIPGAARLRAAICQSSIPDSGALVLGAVRDAKDHSPLAGVAVTGEWLELTLGKAGWVRRVPRLVATTGENGFYAICNVPRGGSMVLSAGRGADSTEVIDLQVPGDGFVRRDLTLGAEHKERLSGVVVKAVDGLPLAGAQVGVRSGPQVRTNERGEWTLYDVPGGTRMLDVRALNYYPQRIIVNVAAGVAPLSVKLTTLKAVLDTIKVTASRNTNANLASFEERRRTGVGKYLTPEDIARRGAMETSLLLRTFPGIYLVTDTTGEEILQMRAIFTEQGGDFAARAGKLPRCTPRIYLDGHYLPINPFELDGWVKPDRIAGLEVYMPGAVPAEFMEAFDACGAIVIWSKRS